MTRRLSEFDALTFDCYGTLIDWEARHDRGPGTTHGPGRGARTRRHPPGPGSIAATTGTDSVRLVTRARCPPTTSASPAWRTWSPLTEANRRPTIGSVRHRFGFLDQCGVVVAHVVGLRGHRVEPDELRGGRQQEALHRIGVVIVAVEPLVPLVGPATSPACGRGPPRPFCWVRP